MDYEPRRELPLRFQLDTNRINSRQALDNMNLLEQWADKEIIELFMSEAAQDEARKGRDPVRSRKALGYIFSETLANTTEELHQMSQIEKILWPGGASTEGQRKDVEIVFNAGKYRATLVTNDGGSRSQPGGLLGNRKALAALGIRVVTDEEAVAMVREAIRNRDEIARMVSSENGSPLPEWVGKD